MLLCRYPLRWLPQTSKDRSERSSGGETTLTGGCSKSSATENWVRLDLWLTPNYNYCSSSCLLDQLNQRVSINAGTGRELKFVHFVFYSANLLSVLCTQVGCQRDVLNATAFMWRPCLRVLPITVGMVGCGHDALRLLSLMTHEGMQAIHPFRQFVWSVEVVLLIE